jgi:hypothetical protein
MASDSRGASRTSSGADAMDDARWFPVGFDARSGEISFVATDRRSVAEQAFLDGRWNRDGLARRRESVKALLGKASQLRPRMNFIWHTGFCCSTLLAKALDHPARNLSLCEPQILVEIADAKRAGAFAHNPSAARIPQVVFQFLGRSFSPGAGVTVKPAPAANHLLPEAALHTAGKMLFLYSDCRSFLISIAKMSEDGRKYARRMFLAILADGNPQAQWPAGQLLKFSDLEIAALVWHMQIAQFRRDWPDVAASRAMSLDCDALLVSPLDTVSKVGAFFELELDGEHLADVVGGPLFRRNAKNPAEPYDADRRRKDHEAVGRQIGPEIDGIVAWSYQLCSTTPRAMPLSHPLVTVDKAYAP